MTETIVAAAIQIEGVTQYAISGATQGFLTSTGRFVNRVMARHIAHRANQNPRNTGGDVDLLSEDLW